MSKFSDLLMPTKGSFRPSEFPDSILVGLSDDPAMPAVTERPSFLSSSWFIDFLVYFSITGLVLGAWQITRMQLFEAGDDVGYWLGVAGAVMMLLLFSYPLRKHFKFARNWGRVKVWFVVHMFLGVGGPVLILIHSTFRLGSLNAAVAFYSMLAVAISGVIGRFIYARVSRGLHGEKATLKDLQKRAGLQQDDAKSRLSFAPEVEARLQAYEQQVTSAKPGWATYTSQVFWLPFKQWLVYRRCSADLRRTLRVLAITHRWKKKVLFKREKYSKLLVKQYLDGVTRVAQFTAYERMFGLWHIAHIPFVYLLVLATIVHVIAVHVY
jgi:hypothetical protein